MVDDSPGKLTHVDSDFNHTQLIIPKVSHAGQFALVLKSTEYNASTRKPK